MADQWYYTENRERRGPVSQEQLKQLATSGKLKSTDKVWKKGMAAWMPASEHDWLFPPSPADADAPSPLTPDDSPPTLPKRDTSQRITAKAKEMAALLASKGKAAAQLVAKQAERTKLVNLTLPAAYQALGKHVHAAGVLRDEFGDLFHKIDGLLKDIEAHSVATPKAEGFAEKARATAKAAQDLAQVQSLKLKLSRTFADLGKAAFEKHGEESGPAEVVHPVAIARTRLEKLDAEIARLSQAQPGQVLTPKRIAIGGFAIAALAVLLLARGMFSSAGKHHAPATPEVAETSAANESASTTGGNARTLDDRNGGNEAASQRTSAAPKTAIALKVAQEASFGKPQPRVITASIQVSPDGKRIAYVAETMLGQMVMLDGTDGPQVKHIGNFVKLDGSIHSYDRIQDLVLSPDGNRVAYHATHHGKQFVVVDAAKGAEHDGIGYIFFSPDSKRVAYGAIRRTKKFAVVDDAAETEYDGIGGILFSPDAQRLGYLAHQGSAYFAVVDRTKGEEYDSTGKSGLVFSPDSRHLAYPALRGNKWLIVVDGTKGKEYDGVGLGGPVFSPDSKRVAYAAQNGSKWFVVGNAAEQKTYDRIGQIGTVYTKRGIVFSPDSKRLAYTAGRNNNWLAVVDGIEGTEYEHIWDLVFSPDSKRFAYAAKRGDKCCVVLDGVEAYQYDNAVIGLVFSPDSKHLAYATMSDNRYVAVVDGAEGKDYDSFLAKEGTLLTWDTATSLHTVALRKGEYMRVTTEIVEGDAARAILAVTRNESEAKTNARNQRRVVQNKDREQAAQFLEGYEPVDIAGVAPSNPPCARFHPTAFLGKRPLKDFHSNATVRWVLVMAMDPMTSFQAGADDLITVLHFQELYIRTLMGRASVPLGECEWEMYLMCGGGVCHVKPHTDVSGLPVRPWLIELHQGRFIVTTEDDVIARRPQPQQDAVLQFLAGRNTQ